MLIWGVIAMFRRVGEPKVVGDQTGLSPIPPGEHLCRDAPGVYWEWCLAPRWPSLP